MRARIGREAQRILSRLRNIRPASLVSTLWRAGRLTVTPPAHRQPQARAERIVVSLTTIPARARNISTVLRSLVDQSQPADRILLALPSSTRSGEAYPTAEALGLPEGVETLSCVDEGPATKFLAALEAEPDALLIVVDDDVIYPRHFIETLLNEHRRRPGAALGFRGVRVQPGVHFADFNHVFATGISETTPVDILFGTWGYLLPPRVLDGTVHDLSSAPEGMRFVDDVWINGHLARRGVPRFVVHADELLLETWSSFRQALTAGVNRSGVNDEMALKHFAKDW